MQKIFLQNWQDAQQTAGLANLKVIYALIAKPQQWNFNNLADVDAKFDAITEWYGDFLVKLANDTQREHFKTSHQAAYTELKAKKQEWFGKRDEAVKQKYQQEALQMVETWLRNLREIIKILPFALKTVTDTLFNAYEESWKIHQQDWLNADEATRAAIDNDIVESVQNTLQQVIERLPDTELAAAEQPLQESLGSLWPVLWPAEQKYLKFAIRLTQDHIHTFACVSFGCAVEFSLRERLFNPLRIAIQQQQLGVVFHDDQDFIAGFFSGHPKAKLGLGNLVGAFNQAFHDGKITTAPENANYLRQGLPHYQTDTDTQKRRREKLAKVPTIRNEIHKTPEQSAKATQKMTEIVFADTADGFYRYFLQST
ncbi:MAG: hypothetical protein BWK79_06850 [Beggiatoa sp. IS2]|nr:MAG: hypothetical protein BWK79_06850 [Beggiatoa sp. IS2]